MFEDKRLINNLRHGDKGALGRIYEKYKGPMYAVAYSLLNQPDAAEDVLHDVFVSFSAVAKNFKLYGSLRNYLITCILNRSRDLLRKKTGGFIDIERTQQADCHAGPEQQVLESEQQSILSRALAKVPADQREVIILHLHGDLKFREIANIQHVPINTVQGRYRYGLEKLRSILDGQVIL